MSSRTFKATCPILIFLLGTVFARAEKINPNNPPAGRFADDWAEIYMQGDKVGYYHSAMTRHDDLVDTEITFHMRMGRAEQPVTIAMTQRVTEKLDGTQVAVTSDALQPGMQVATAIKTGEQASTARPGASTSPLMPSVGRRVGGGAR